MQVGKIRSSIEIALVLLVNGWLLSTTRAGPSLHDDSECSLYLAPSSIPDAGLGIFSTKHFQQGSIILPSDAPIIPIIDWDTSLINTGEWNKLFYSYLWTHSQCASDELNFEGDNVVDLQVGLGIFPNFHPFLHNLETALPLENSGTFSETSGPGAGAYSLHPGRIFKAAKEIQQGEELFLNYGENYLNVRKHLNYVPRAADYEMAGKLMEKLLDELGQPYHLALNSMPNSTSNRSSSFPINRDIIDTKFVLSSLKAMIEPISSRIAAILPDNLQDLDNVMNKIDDENNLDRLSVALAKSSGHRRDIKWLKEHGTCLDNVKVGSSNIPHAGKGAFASRDVAKGGVVVPVPLLQIMGKTAVDMHKVHIDHSGNFIHDKSKRTGSQLLMNYCFSHFNTSFFLCPTTNAILINDFHGHYNEPNAELIWSDDTITMEWLKMSPEEMDQDDRGLVINVVALKNISKGEEITIDYGSNWNKAWKNHLKQWDNVEKANDARQENDMFTACLYSDDGSWPASSGRFDGDWTAFSDRLILDFFGNVYETGSVQHSFWPCSIIESNDEATSTVQIFQSKWHPTTKWQNLDIPRFLLQFPNSHIKRFYKPYSSDLHTSKAFRHFIEIPDHLIPDNWRDNHSEKVARSYKLGEQVEANFMMEGTWFSARVTNVNPNGSYDVSYDDGDVEHGVNCNDVRHIQRNIVQTITKFHPFF